MFAEREKQSPERVQVYVLANSLHAQQQAALRFAYRKRMYSGFLYDTSHPKRTWQSQKFCQNNSPFDSRLRLDFTIKMFDSQHKEKTI